MTVKCRMTVANEGRVPTYLAELQGLATVEPFLPEADTA